MFKKVLLGFSLFLLSNQLMAFDFSVQIKGGGNISKQYGDTLDDVKNKKGIDNSFLMSVRGGLGLEFGFVPLFAMELGSMFAIRGADLENAAGAKGDIQLLYLDIPLKFKFRFMEDRRFGFNFFVGPMVSVLLNEMNQNLTYEGGTSTLDAGFTVGGGVRFNISDKFIALVDMEYWHGFMSYLSKSAFDVKHFGFYIGPGIGWVFGKDK